MSRVLGDNGGVSEAVFFAYDRERSSLRAQAAAINGKVRALNKRAEEDGLDVQEYEYQRKRRDRPLEERRKSYEAGRLYLKFWKDPLGAQLAEIAEVKDEIGLTDDERLKKWEDEGYVVGMRGGNRTENPHPDPNSLGARTWSAGYDKGQAKLAPKKAGKAPAAVADGPAVASTDTTGGKLTGGVAKEGKPGPKDEPEVAAAKARGGKGRTKGVTYWHNAELRKVYEITTADPDPEGAVSITKPEFERLKAEYAKAEEDDWNSTGSETKPGTMAEPPAEKEDADEDEDPPASVN